MNRIFPLLIIMILGASCTNKDKDDWTESLSAFTLSDDSKFGELFDTAILADEDNFQVLNEAGNEEAYSYVTGIIENILNSSLIEYKDSFEWEVRIINDTVKNAFAVPGGKIYLYKGFIDYIENGSQLAGVLGHLIAHVDRRHMSQLLSKAYGETEILALINGANSNITYSKIALDLESGASNLELSEANEYLADEYSVQYLNDIKDLKDYNCKGIAGFLEKIQKDNFDGESFQFIANHNFVDGRLQNIDDVWLELGEPIGNKFEIEFLDFKSNLGLLTKQMLFEDSFDSAVNLTFKSEYGENGDTAYAVANDGKILLFASGNGKAEAFISIDTIKVDSLYLEIGFNSYTGQYYPGGGGDIIPVVSSHFAFNFDGKFLGVDASIEDFTFSETVVQFIYHGSSNELIVMDGNTNVSEYFFMSENISSLNHTSLYFNATSMREGQELTQCETIIDYVKIHTYK